jgi:hypothetical protein
MKSFKFINNTSVNLTILAVVILTTAQVGLGQFNIKIEIPKIKLPEKKVIKTEPTPENNEINSTTENSTVAQDEPPEWWLNVMISDIKTAKEEVDLYTNPQERLYLVSTPSSPWLLRAVSAKARDEFAADKKFNDWRKANKTNKFDAALDELAEAAAGKLPGYIPNADNFAIHDKALEQMIKGKLKNAATLKISKIGLLHSNWIIEKNDLGIPVNRYREAFIWAKDSADDHEYCHQYGFVIQQDYAGGGTYGATGTYLNTDSIFGCPVK